MEIPGLAVGRPVAVGTLQRKIELVEQLSDITMAARRQHFENLARFAVLQII